MPDPRPSGHDRKSTCVLCGAHPADGLEKVVAYGAEFRRCSGCGFIQRVTMEPANVSGQGSTAGVGSGNREIFLSRVLKNHFGAGPILLYGTGYSPAFKRLLDDGVDVYGCDLTEELIETRRKEFGTDRWIHHAELERSGKTFDGVVATEVIEHFSEPGEEARRLATIMSDRGIFCGSTNFVFDGRIEGNRDYFKLRSHVALFSEQSWTRFAEMQGRRASLFKMITPGSGFPGLYAPAYPDKRVFFSYPAAAEEHVTPLRGFSHFPILGA